MSDQSFAAPVSVGGAPRPDDFSAVTQTVRRLVGADGCAWHQEQTHASLTQYVIEEAAELVEAIDQRQTAEQMLSELADVLYQVLFHAVIAERDGEGYGPVTVAQHLNEKLIARHPHVFGDRGPMSVAELNAEWEQLKEDASGQRRGSRGVLEGIPAAMPTLAKAEKVVSRAKRAGVWRDPVAMVADHAEVNAVQNVENVGLGDTAGAVIADEESIGLELLRTVERAYDLGVNADRALRVQLERHAARLTGAGDAQNMEE